MCRIYTKNYIAKYVIIAKTKKNANNKRWGGGGTQESKENTHDNITNNEEMNE